MNAFQLHNITSVGKRGRPAFPRTRTSHVERVLSDKGAELGLFSLEPQSDGSVLLRAIIDGKTKTITYPAKAAPRTARARKVAKATPAKGRKVTAARKATKRTAAKS